MSLGEARRLCLAFGDLYARRHDIMAEASAAGMSVNEIAAKMCVGRQTVADCLRRREGARDHARSGRA